MKYTHLVEPDYRNAASLALTYLRPQLSEEGFDVAPPDVPAGWMREDCFERALVLAPHFLWYHKKVLQFKLRRPSDD